MDTIKPKSYEQSRYVAIMTLMAILFWGCASPTEFGASVSVADIVDDLITAYNEKNLDLYLHHFGESSQFREGSDILWGKPEEAMIHSRLFTGADKLDLQLRELRLQISSPTQEVRIYKYGRDQAMSRRRRQTV